MVKKIWIPALQEYSSLRRNIENTSYNLSLEVRVLKFDTGEKTPEW